MLMHTIDHLYILLACFNKIFVLLALMIFGNGMLQPFPLLKHALFQGFKIIILLLFFYSVMRWNGKKTSATCCLQTLLSCMVSCTSWV